jgi:hypothetical protein
MRYKRRINLRKRAFPSLPKYTSGQLVRIVNPVIVDRVGYPLTPEMVYKELNTSENRQRIIDMLSDFDVPVGREHFDVFSGTIPPNEVEGVLRVISYYTVRVRHFGGPERSLHTREIPSLKDLEVYVDEKKTVRTGTRIPGWSNGEDWESAYLDKPKSHVLLRFRADIPDAKGHMTVGTDLWIESCNVEKA